MDTRRNHSTIGPSHKMEYQPVLFDECHSETGYNSLLTTNPSFDNTNYSIKQYSIAPDLSYTRHANLRITVGYNYNPQKNDPLYGGETSYSSAVNTDVKYNLVSNTSLEAKFTLNDLHYIGTANTTVSYIILDGLLPGKNYIWSLDLTKKLGSFLELNVTYEGRKPGEGNVIHTGRASLQSNTLIIVNCQLSIVNVLFSIKLPTIYHSSIPPTAPAKCGTYRQPFSLNLSS